ncbi:helix-turn-helix transcriptional regulator [Arthrobacter sp. ISL-72]|uniref:helix-turn-helix transcriptional regulator n=1 Tax=Arthrobacter sp. ISL-72 TaxID=2819114 RepID=UPI001BEC4494|nr:helix-turn-helix transcriptional regulator [Arthrobacter sp. ISL-72]MBT2596504.1 helix-turn-helix domain-containing protein [Arthrobacter sp. ISL-72]
MDNRNDIREFLTTRRARISPQQAGLPDYGGHRRVPGLRRGEVAMLAGVSPEYYTRLEQGKLAGVSESILHSLAEALQLDDAEQSHLFDLARTAGSTPRPRRRPKQQIPPSLQYALDAITGVPAFVRNGRLDILATNVLGQALYSAMYTDESRPVNIARFVFLNRRAVDFYPDWIRAASDTVAVLRAESGRDPYNKELSELVGELSTRSEEFRTRWAAHNVRRHTTGHKHFHHPVVGDIELMFNALEHTADPGLTLLLYSAEPGSAAEDALRLLGSLAATPDQAGHPETADATE